MQKLGYAKSTAVRSYREVNTRARVSVSPLKWKAIISDGVIAWVVQLRTKTCNSNAVLLVDWRGNNKVTRSQSHMVQTNRRSASETMLQRGVHKAVGSIRTDRCERHAFQTEQKHAADLQTCRRHAHSHLLPHTRSLRETRTRRVRVVWWEAFSLFLRDDGEAQRGTLLPFKVKETNAHVSRANRQHLKGLINKKFRS